jgi:hypothetical protein
MNSEVKSIGFAISPDNVPSFLLDWEVTKRCNLDCSYCLIGVEGGHDNSTQHPPLLECLKSIDFMYDYVSLYMRHKKPTQRKVILNVYGGESLFHPNIIEILTYCREKYKEYNDHWELSIITTTNGIINTSIWQKIIPLVDEFTVSYHSESLPKQKKLFFNNLLELKKQNKKSKCLVMMHNDPKYWENSIRAVDFCIANDINYIVKPLDNLELSYTEEQFSYMKDYWISTTNSNNREEAIKQLTPIGKGAQTISLCEGRACCGGRKLSLNNELKSSVTFVPRQGFKDWYCSVNWFFLHVRQLDGSVYINKDCRMSFSGKVAPIGNLSNTKTIIDNLTDQLTNKMMPVIQCAKQHCLCGFCAPKAQNLNDFKELISRNVISDVINYGIEQ